MVDEHIEDHANAAAGVNLAVGDEPGRDRNRRQRRQNTLNQRLCVAYLVDDRADAETALDELPKHHVVLGMKRKISSRQLSRIVDAHRRVEGRHKRGTVVVTIAA